MMVFGAAIAYHAGAQLKEGTITYERKINMHKRIQDEQIRAMIPEFTTTKHLLLFNDSTSLYKAMPADEAPDPFESGNTRIVIRSGGGDNEELYKNFATNSSIRTTDIGSKTYIIEDKIKAQQWKLTDESKKILGYNCRKATTQQKMQMRSTTSTTVNGNAGKAATDTTANTMEVTAWYAEDIVSPVGPDNNGGLPGVILELNMNNGEMIYTATDIKKEVNKKEIKAPTKGKKITNDEFTKLQQQMIDNMGGGGRTMRFGG